ncbi:MAG: hypothetical protein V1832_02000 [Nitrospirota bacterium]|jgi:hypothetical protein
MIDLKALISSVKKNCTVSDATYWGYYSLCGLLLRLRELYRSERGLRPWERINQEEISEWISERENLWKELEGKGFEDIITGEQVYDPFEVERINAVLEKENLLYSAGYGIHMKPSFFLADLLSKKKVEGHVVYIAGHEYARDLAHYPATLQDGIIFARVDTTRHLLWEKFEELRLRGPKGSLAFAFSRYGIKPEDESSEDLYRRMFQVAFAEVETYIYHELGEAFEATRLGGEWDDLLVDFSGTKIEVFARGVKDLLSDTAETGMIRHIIENRKEGSLGFYIVFLGGYRKPLFPEIIKAFEGFVESGDWGLIEDARKAGYGKAEVCAERLLSFRREKRDQACISEYIDKELLSSKKSV